MVASFAIFAVDQTNGTSSHQQQELSGGVATTAGAPRRPARPATASTHESSLHKAIDEASNQLTSPFSGVISGSSSEWAIRGVKLLLALLVYGFGLGYLARVIRVRV